MLGITMAMNAMASGISASNMTIDTPPVCSFQGVYRSEDGLTQNVKFNGMCFDRTDSTGGGCSLYSDSGAVIHDCGLSTGTFQSNCNVISWSNGGTWIRTNK